MYSTARMNVDAWVGLNYGTIRISSKGDYAVEGPSGIIKARRAAGCLLEPKAGDVVLFSENPAAMNYILCVLEKGENNENLLSVSGGLKIQTDNGSLAFSADKVEMAGEETISLKTPDLDISAGRARTRIGEAKLNAESIDVESGSIQLKATSFDSVLERMTQKVRRSFRWVQEIEHLKAGRVRAVVSDVWSIISGKADIKAEDKVRINGKRIDLG